MKYYSRDLLAGEKIWCRNESFGYHYIQKSINDSTYVASSELGCIFRTFYYLIDAVNYCHKYAV